MTHRITMFALLLAAGLAHALEAPQLSLSTQYNPELDCVQVQLSWPSVSGAEVYEVYYRDPAQRCLADGLAADHDHQLRV